MNPSLKQVRNEYTNYFQTLFQEAFKKQPLEFIYNLLKVDGMYYGHWNPFEELQHFQNDFKKVLREAIKTQQKEREIRIRLLIYCHLTESNYYYEFLSNILRVLNNQPYIVEPFSDLIRNKNPKSLFSKKIPPSVNQKRKRLKEQAFVVSEDELTKMLEEHYSDEIRNSFYHSDYCITLDGYRYPLNNGLWTEITHKELISLTKKATLFYESLYTSIEDSLKELSQIHHYQRLPQYEVLELLSKRNKLFGYKIHFSNGNFAMFTRDPEQVVPYNLIFEKDGSINYNVGNLGELKQDWFIGKLTLEEVMKKQKQRETKNA